MEQLGLDGALESLGFGAKERGWPRPPSSPAWRGRDPSAPPGVGGASARLWELLDLDFERMSAMRL